MKKFGFGLMRLPTIGEEKDNIDLETTKEMVDFFLKEGFTYFDTAWFYHKEKSEDAIRKCLTERYPRNEYILADKLPIALLEPENKNSSELRKDLDYYFNNQKKRCGVEYFDYYLLHALDKKKFEVSKTYNAYEFILEKKKNGEIKNVGFSFHDTSDILEEILIAYPEMDFVQLQINYLDWEHETIESRKCYEIAKKYNMTIIVMEPLKGGTLSKLPKEAEKILKSHNPKASISSWAMRYAASLDNIFMVLSGMSNLEQIKDNCSYMNDFKPLESAEKKKINQVVNIIKNSSIIECTECEYCLNECPSNIPIPTYFTLFNRDTQGLGEMHKEKYKDIISRKSTPSACIECGACEDICPQHLTIIKYLKDVEKHFE